jgi:hypothetical protein
MSPLSLTGRCVSHRQELWVRQYYRCHYCNRLTDFNKSRFYGYTATVEHVLPRGRGGTSTLENKVISCERCNTTRNLIEQRMVGRGRWEDINVPAELFLKLLPVDIAHWKMHNVDRLNAVIEAMRWGWDSAALQTRTAF